MSPRRRAVFLDRDGVILRFISHLHRPEQTRLLAGAGEAIRSLRTSGFLVILASNQSAIARGLLTEAGLAEIHRRMSRGLRRRGARLDAIYYCPHHPDFGRRVRCRCRKRREDGNARGRRPALPDHLRASYLVGDTTSDMETARRAGAAGVLVRTGLGGRDGKFRARPARICRNLLGAARWILKKSGI